MPNEPGKKPVLHTKKHVARLERERRQARIVLFAFFGILITVLLLIGYGFLDVNYLQLNKPVAKVGDTEISARDFEAQVRLERQQLLNSYNVNMQYSQLYGIDTTAQLEQIKSYLDLPEFLGQTVLNQMIDDELVRQEAAKRGITVSTEELDKYIQGQFRYFPEGTPTPTLVPTKVATPEIPVEAFDVVTVTPSPNPVTATPTGTSASIGTDIPSIIPTITLAPTSTPTTGPTATALPTATPFTFEGFQVAYQKGLEEYARFDVSEAGFRKLFETRILREKLMSVVVTDVIATEEQVWARHILVSDSAVASTIIDRLNAGDDFGALARELSEDTGSAVNGGDLGWFGKGAMVAEFETAAFALEKPGDITPAPIKSQFGYHIIQLIARQSRALDAGKLEDTRNDAFNDWLAKIREEYAVETYNEFWIPRVPNEPNFITMATESANAVKTQQAEAGSQATAAPK